MPTQITIHEVNTYLHPSDDPKTATDDAEKMNRGGAVEGLTRTNYNKQISTAKPSTQRPPTAPTPRVTTVTTTTAPGSPVAPPPAIPGTPTNPASPSAPQQVTPTPSNG